MTIANATATKNAENFSADDKMLCTLLKDAVFIGNTAHLEAAETDDVNLFPVKTLAYLREKGFLTAPLSAEFGGCGLGTEHGKNSAMLQTLKHLGRGNLVVGRVYEGHLNALLLLRLYASAAQYAHFASETAQGNLFGVWNTEALDGVRVELQDDGNFQLSGAKTFATGSGFVSRPFVNGRMPDGGWQMTVVPLDTTIEKFDKSWWNPLGMRATRSFKFDFSDTELSAQSLIGSANQYYEQPWFSGGAIRFAAVQLGGAEAIFDETRRYLRDLNRTSDSFQQTRLGEMAILVENGNLWLESAAQKFDEYLLAPNAANNSRLLAYINAARTVIEEICLEVIKLCQKCVGARGLNKPFHFERIIRDLTIYLRQPAPDAALASVGEYVAEREENAFQIWNTAQENV